MRKAWILLLAISFSLGLSAQEESTCYQRYAKVFEVRGAFNVADGWHDDVVVTIRKGSFADCFLGKVKVDGGVIDTRSIALVYVDDTYEKFVRSYRNEIPITISNGISKTFITDDDELINVMFVGAIKPKKKAYQRAPDPSTFMD